VGVGKGFCTNYRMGLAARENRETRSVFGFVGGKVGGGEEKRLR